MNKLTIALAALLIIVSCKGPGSGPLAKESFNKAAPAQTMDGKTHMGQVTIEKINVTIEPCQDCITIAKLFEGKKTFSGKNVKVTGKVTKFNPSIMGKNWVHIQDGTEFQGEFDLTITTDAMVSVGETVTFEGKLALDKDFGYGYSYKVLLEESKTVQ